MFEGSPAVTQYIDRLIDARLQGAEIEPETRKSLHENLMELLNAQATGAIVNQLNERQQLELEHLIDSDQIGKIEEYLKSQGINLTQLLAGVMADFQATYLGV